MSRIVGVLDTCLASLTMKDEYELAHTALQVVHHTIYYLGLLVTTLRLQALLSWLTRSRLLEPGPRVRGGQGWGDLVHIDEVAVEWYIPGRRTLVYLTLIVTVLNILGEKEMTVVHSLLQRFLAPVRLVQ